MVISKVLLIFIIAVYYALILFPCALLAAPLKMGVLPVLDTLPLHVAVQDNLFADQGLEVELVNFSSALERDVAMQGGQLDGYFGDLLNSLLLIQSGVPMRIFTVAYATQPGQRMFALLAAPGSAVTDLKQAKGMRVGISSATIIEYLLERYGNGRLLPPAGTPERLRYRYWLHFAEGSAMPPLLMKLVFSKIARQTRTKSSGTMGYPQAL